MKNHSLKAAAVQLGFLQMRIGKLSVAHIHGCEIEDLGIERETPQDGHSSLDVRSPIAQVGLAHVRVFERLILQAWWPWSVRVDERTKHLDDGPAVLI